MPVWVLPQVHRIRLNVEQSDYREQQEQMVRYL